ncbi:MAG: hypothetical protein H5T78_08870 [Nocardia sp.]|nr:hypothetical protein [Nocardia sp.]
MRHDLQELSDDANTRAAQLADKAGQCSVPVRFGFLPVRLVPRIHPHDAASYSVAVVHRWRAPGTRSRQASVVPDHLEVDPDAYSLLDGRARDALLAVELTVAEFSCREARLASAMRARRTRSGTGCASWDRILERSSTGWPAVAFFAVVAVAAMVTVVSLCVPGMGIGAILGGAVIVGAMVWAAESAFKRGEYLKADKNAARLVGADAVRYMLMTLQASEPHRRGAAAARRRWWGYRPTVGHRLKSLNREFPSPALSS